VVLLLQPGQLQTPRVLSLDGFVIHYSAHLAAFVRTHLLLVLVGCPFRIGTALGDELVLRRRLRFLELDRLRDCALIATERTMVGVPALAACHQVFRQFVLVTTLALLLIHRPASGLALPRLLRVVYGYLSDSSDPQIVLGRIFALSRLQTPLPQLHFAFALSARDRRLELL